MYNVVAKKKKGKKKKEKVKKKKKRKQNRKREIRVNTKKRFNFTRHRPRRRRRSIPLPVAFVAAHRDRQCVRGCISQTFGLCTSRQRAWSYDRCTHRRLVELHGYAIVTSVQNGKKFEKKKRKQTNKTFSAVSTARTMFCPVLFVSAIYRMSYEYLLVRNIYCGDIYLLC